MHLTIAPGIYVVGGRDLTHESDCTVILLCSLKEDKCVLLGCGAGESSHAIARNIIELGISLRSIEYVVVPMHSACIANCRSLTELVPWIRIAAPPDVAPKLRKGIDVEPVPVSYESYEMVFDGITLRFSLSGKGYRCIDAVVDGRTVRLCLAFLSDLPEVTNRFKEGILCLLDATRCINLVKR